MLVAGLATCFGLYFLKSQFDLHQLRHVEVMSGIARLKTSIGEAAPRAASLFASITAENKAVLSLLSTDRKVRQLSLQYLEKNWQSTALAKVIEVLPFLSSDPDSGEREPVIELLSRMTGKQCGSDIEEWRKFSLTQGNKDDWLSGGACRSYLDFKALLYHRVDPQFIHYFAGHDPVEIDPREICWQGGPLNNPTLPATLINAGEAGFMRPTDLVFGIEESLNASDSLSVSAYPQRILVWHNVVEDKPARLIFYNQTKCKALAFNRKIAEKIFNFNDSGFVYRGQKLLSDQQSKSLWLPEKARMVLAPTGSTALQLTPLPVVACSWRAWLSKFPQSKILSSQTGFNRAYESDASVK